MQLLTGQAGARLQAWQRAEEKRRAKALKLQQLAKYSGVMSGSDKDFITRIQISNLVSPNPYVDDFYAHVYFAVRGGGRRVPLPDPSSMAAIASEKQAAQQQQGEERPKGAARRKLTRHENAMLRMQQQVERLVENRKKRIAHATGPTGALGKVSASSANKPRQMLQLINESDAAPAERATATHGEQQDAMRMALEGTSLSTDAPVDKRKPLTRRETLVLLERLYDLVLALEQLRRAAPSAEGEAEQARLTDQLWRELRVLEPLDVSDPHPFVSLMNHVKGKRLLPRVLRLLSSEQALTTLTMLVAMFGAIDAVRDYGRWEQHRIRTALRQTPDPLSPRAAHEMERNIEACSNSVVFYMISLVSTAPLRIVSGMLALMMDRNDVVAVAKTRPGVSILTVLLSRAEALRQASDPPAAPDELEQWTNVFGVLLERLSVNGQLAELFPSTRFKAMMPFGLEFYRASLHGPGAPPPHAFDADAEDEPVWNLMALLAIHANLAQQQVLVQELRDKILGNVLAANEAAGRNDTPPAEDVRIRNVNLLLHALNLDATQITL